MSDSSDSFSPSDDDLFSIADHEDLDDTDDSDLDDEDFDIEKQVPLYGGNLHPPEYYRQRIENPQKIGPYDRYAATTQDRLKEVEELWKEFRRSLKYDESFESTTSADVQAFLEWMMNQVVGKGGRRKRGITSRGSLEARWKFLARVANIAMGKPFPQRIYDEAHVAIERLTKEHKLKTSRRRNRPMTVDALMEMILECLRTTKQSFKLGLYRIYIVVFLLLLSPGGSRPLAILMLRFRDVEVTLTRDPEGGPDNLMIRFTPEFTKTYLGAKETSSFNVPEAIFHRSLLLNLHVFLLGLLFYFNAFENDELTCPEDLGKLSIEPGENEMLLPFKEELHDVFLFRKVVQTPEGFDVSVNDRITYAMMARWIRIIGVLIGIAIVIAYSLRYMVGNKLDQAVNISDSLRNLCLGHGNSATFQNHYLSREICADTLAIILGEKQQQALVAQASSISHSKSKRRPERLDAEDIASINEDHRIRSMKEKIQGMPRGAKRQKLTLELRNAKARMKNRRLAHKKERFTREQAIKDISRQLGGDHKPTPAPATPSAPPSPAQKRLIEAITAPAQATLEGQLQRRNAAICAIMDYCSVEEGPTVSRQTVGVKAKQPTPSREAVGAIRQFPVATELQKPTPESLEVIRSVFVLNPSERLRKCFMCVGKAASLEQGDARFINLVQDFSTHREVTKHFQRSHLRHIQPCERIFCQICKMPLGGREALQRHALQIHGIQS